MVWYKCKIKHKCWWIIVVLVWPSDYNIFYFLDLRLEQKAAFYAFSWNSGVEELIKSLFVREIGSDCCCSIFEQLASSPLSTGATDSFVEFSKQKIFTYPFPSKCIGICRRNGNLSSKQSVVQWGQKYCRMLRGEHSAILSTFIKLPFVIKIFVFSIFEWLFLHRFYFFRIVKLYELRVYIIHFVF